jgi:hypothetical protein
VGQFRPLGAHQIAGRQDILVAMDWTNFDHDDQARSS